MELRTFTGPSVLPHLADVARLRIEVFREFPYLYDGDPGYESSYLEGYAKSDSSLFVLAFDGTDVVGASTGMPLSDEGEAFKKPFLERNMALGEVFYFGESVLLKPYRGRGLGHAFFDAREAHAKSLGFSVAAFCAVERAASDPRRPPDHRDNDAFWTGRGYQKQPGMVCHLEWQQIDESAPSSKSLCFWLRKLVL